MTHFVFKIDAMPGAAPDTTAYFVVPGRPGAQAIVAPDDGEAVRMLRRSYPGEALVFEPRLAQAARRAGYETDEITPERAHYIGLTAFDLALPGALKDVRNEGLVYQFGIAAARFHQVAPQQRPWANSALELAHSGAFGGRRRAWLLGVDGGEPGVATYAMPEGVSAVEHKLALGPPGLKKVDTIGVVFNRSMPFANDAMSRAYGVPALPVPIKVEQGRDAALTDRDLLLLAALLRAIAALPDDGAEGSGYVKVGDDELSVIAWRA